VLVNILPLNLVSAYWEFGLIVLSLGGT